MQFIKGMYGLGDCIYQRAFLREIKEHVYLETMWPQLYADFPHVCPVMGKTKLRTQKKNALAQPSTIWHPRPIGVRPRRVHYHFGPHSLVKSSILAAMRTYFGVQARIFDLPNFGPSPVKGEYALVRPCTVRREWANSARNPRSNYIKSAGRIVRNSGLKLVSVADLELGEEWAEGALDCDVVYDRGELRFEQLMALLQGASFAFGGMGWLFPAAVAASVPVVIILGGQGGLNAPSKVSGPPMNLSKVRWLIPDNFCLCTKRSHRCKKRIIHFEEKFTAAFEDLCLKIHVTMN